MLHALRPSPTQNDGFSKNYREKNTTTVKKIVDEFEQLDEKQTRLGVKGCHERGKGQKRVIFETSKIHPEKSFSSRYRPLSTTNV